ncbi:MAG: NAD(P)/FAD-dependent oxidoreductase, partial [Euryarchaeota archaeon]|nr:NAD(P)/FAD-dependent oxidoreductase [Euryarchaeota archaeon]
MYDAVIAGAGFAGLATAFFARECRVLVVEREKELGARQRSTCAAPLSWIRRLGAESSVLSVFDRVVMHSPSGNEARIPLQESYCTIDYAEFCRRVAERVEWAEFLKDTRVTGATVDGVPVVHTSSGSFSCEMLVDATGWRAVVASSLRRGYAPSKGRITALETVGEYDSRDVHIYYGSRFVPGGYAWVFPAGSGRARIGLGSMRRLRLVKLNRRFLEFLGVERTEEHHHGGVIPCEGLREPVVSQVFVVGDAAGQVLPSTAEGIRKCFEFGEVCGRLMSRVAAGELSREEALRRYAESVRAEQGFYRTMLRVQEVVYRLPDRAMDLIIGRINEPTARKL